MWPSGRQQWSMAAIDCDCQTRWRTFLASGSERPRDGSRSARSRDHRALPPTGRAEPRREVPTVSTTSRPTRSIARGGGGGGGPGGGVGGAGRQASGSFPTAPSLQQGIRSRSWPARGAATHDYRSLRPLRPSLLASSPELPAPLVPAARRQGLEIQLAMCSPASCANIFLATPSTRSAGCARWLDR